MSTLYEKILFRLSHTASLRSFYTLLQRAKSLSVCRLPTGHLALSSPLYIGYLVVSVGQACNLRCRDCGNFAPFAPKETLRYSINDIIENLRIITQYAEIRLLQIQGGEPFLHPELETLLQFVRACPQIKKCQIATNGTILPKVAPASLLGKKFMVRISDYSVSTEMRDQVCRWLDANAIRYILYRFVSHVDKWCDLGKKCSMDNDVEARFQACDFNACLTLENGVLAHCSRAVVAQKVQKITGEGGFLPVIDSDGFKKKLEEYITAPHHMDACYCCNGTREAPLIEPAVQLQPGETWNDFFQV